MDCAECHEALSARLDGEESEAERGAIDTHLKTCAPCRRFADDAARVTRLARTGIATKEPDVAEAVLAAAPRPPRPPLVTVLRVLLGLVGLAQLQVAVIGVLGAGRGSPQVTLQGASMTHLAHESAAWNLALGAGFLWVAWRRARTSGMVPTVATFVVVLTGLVVLDVVAGRVDPERFLLHSLVVLGLVLLIALDRLVRPAGGTAPGIPMPGQRWSRRSSSGDPVITKTDSPPGLRPTAQRDRTVVVQRRVA